MMPWLSWFFDPSRCIWHATRDRMSLCGKVQRAAYQAHFAAPIHFGAVEVRRAPTQCKVCTAKFDAISVSLRHD